MLHLPNRIDADADEREAIKQYHERLVELGALTPFQRDTLDANLEKSVEVD